MSELYFDVPCYYDGDPNHDPKETNAKYRFIANVYLNDKITEFIKLPLHTVDSKPNGKNTKKVQ